jgi:YD repeat-containing protein
MINIKNDDGSWYKAETEGKVLTYTDSDGVWMKEKYDQKGRIVSREDSFGNWEKFAYKFDETKKKEVLSSHVKGSKNA